MNILSVGAQGADVKTMQQDLAMLGYAIATDGVFGNDTKNVIIQFQMGHNLTADGIVGDSTWALINSLLVKGMDLSHLNGPVEWDNLSPQIQFVYCKATEGPGFKDPMLQNYLRNVKQKGLINGVYHFLTFEAAAQVQADNFLACGFDFSAPGTLPPALDVEWQVPDSLNPYILDNKAACIQLISDWLQIVATKTGRTPVIYTAKSFWSEYLGNPAGFENYPLWIPAYQPNPPGLPPGWNKYAIWQYAESGALQGTSNDVDQDVFNGTIDDLQRFALMNAV